MVLKIRYPPTQEHLQMPANNTAELLFVFVPTDAAAQQPPSPVRLHLNTQSYTKAKFKVTKVS